MSNPAAGGGSAARRTAQALAVLDSLGFTVEVRSTTGPGHARQLAAELAATVDVVAALGGDGTVNEVVNGLAGRGVPLAVLPGGTVNVLALDLGLPLDLPSACALLNYGAVARLDLGRVGGRWFALMAGAGLDALAVRTVAPAAKRHFPRTAFVEAGVRSFLTQPQPRFRVVVDGRPHDATFAVMANCRCYAGRFGLAVAADAQDGLFDVMLYSGTGFARTAAFWVASPVGLHPRHPDVTVVRGRQVDLQLLDPADRVWLQTDGEPAGCLPASAGVAPAALEVVVPRQG